MSEPCGKIIYGENLTVLNECGKDNFLCEICNLMKYSSTKLKVTCQYLGLKTSGSKRDIVERLVNYKQAEQLLKGGE